jgi:hypothetical protein
MKKYIFTVLSAAVLAVASANYAKADVITFTAVGTPVIAGGVASWTYDVALSGEEVQTTGTQFGTLYGFNLGSQAPVIASSTGLLSTNFHFSITPGVITPAALNQVFTALPGGDSIRFTWDDSSNVGNFNPPQPVDLGTFTVKSSTLSSASSWYDGQAVNSVGLGGNSHPILVAVVTPEPMSMSLLGGGLALLGLLRFRRK